MTRTARDIRWWGVLLALAAVGGAFWIGLQRVHVESDLTSSVPGGSPTLEASRRMLLKHPIVDRVAIDLSISEGAPAVAQLTRAAELVQQRLRQSRLFQSVGHQQSARAVAALYRLAAERLPVLFGADELQKSVTPLLTHQRVDETMRVNFEELVALGGMGQSQLMARDPLRLRNLVLERLEHLVPTSKARIENNHIVSTDGRHLLLTAVPLKSAGDPDASRRLEDLFAQISHELEQKSAAPGERPVVLTVAGAYRAAADNERIARQDTARTVALVTLGIALLLLACFARPLLGLLALVPAGAGVAGALLVYSFFSPSLSALALGFGAALVSITVDQGIIFVSFFDRVRGISGGQAAREVFPAGSLSTLTTAGAFIALRFSGYPLLAQLGTFAALGIVISFVFVQLVFPLLFRRSSGLERKPLLPVAAWLHRLNARSGSRVLLGVASVCVLLGAYARPRFEVDLNALNTVSEPTRRAEQQIREVWGNVFEQVYVLIEGDTVAEVQAKADAWTHLLQKEQQAKRLARGWSPSWFCPGPDLAAENARAWQQFWKQPRAQSAIRRLGSTGETLGFSEDAFATFTSSLQRPESGSVPMPDDVLPLLGIARARDGNGWVWLGSVRRGPAYDANSLAASAAQQGIMVFDGKHFGDVLSEFLRRAFVKLILLVGAFVLLSVALAFLDVRLALVTLAPIVAGLLCTLGALRLLNRAIDVPGLMLAIVIFGLGIDFSFHFMRSRQRRPREDDPGHDSVRVAVFLAAASTTVGMLSLVLAQHAALRSAGVGGLLGIVFCAAGAFLILPPLQRWLFSGPPEWVDGATLHRLGAAKATRMRYRNLMYNPRIHAWLKLRLDPMFPRLDELVGSSRRLLDVGCGFAVPTVWLAVQHPDLEVIALESDPVRVKTASWVLQGRGTVIEGAAPALPPEVEEPDTALLLDVGHYLTDDQLTGTIQAIHQCLAPNGKLVLRDTVPGHERPPQERWVERLMMRLRGQPAYFRSAEALTALLKAAGFQVRIEATPGREETWFVGTKR